MTTKERLTLASSSSAAKRSFSTYSMAFTSWFVVRSTSFTAAASATLNREAKPSSRPVASWPNGGTSVTCHCRN